MAKLNNRGPFIELHVNGVVMRRWCNPNVSYRQMLGNLKEILNRVLLCSSENCQETMFRGSQFDDFVTLLLYYVHNPSHHFVRETVKNPSLAPLPFSITNSQTLTKACVSTSLINGLRLLDRSHHQTTVMTAV